MNIETGQTISQEEYEMMNLKQRAEYAVMPQDAKAQTVMSSWSRKPTPRLRKVSRQRIHAEEHRKARAEIERLRTEANALRSEIAVLKRALAGSEGHV